MEKLVDLLAVMTAEKESTLSGWLQSGVYSTKVDGTGLPFHNNCQLDISFQLAGEGLFKGNPG
jgi:hypothetical protein